MRDAEAQRHILSRFRADLRRRRGLVRRAEGALGKSRGYLAKATRGAFRIPLDVLLAALDALDIEAGTFFARALDAVIETEDLLADLAADRPADTGERHFLARARQLGGDPPGTAWAPIETGSDAEPMAARLARGTRGQQRRWMREGRYHHPSILLAYLAHLDRQRGHPRDAAILAGATVVTAVPHLAARDRSEIVIRALAVAGTARGACGELSAAARALGLGLELTRRYPPAAGELLRRTAWILAAANLPRYAQQTLREALEVAVIHDDEPLRRAVLATRRDLFEP